MKYDQADDSMNEHYKKLDDVIRKKLIEEILVDEFKDSRFSLPPRDFITIFDQEEDKYKYLISSIISDPVEFSKFGSEMLKIAIDKKNDFVVKKIFNEIFDF